MPLLAKNEYLMRHDKVCTHLHYSICKALGFETTDKRYTHIPKPVCEKGDVKVLWNQAVHTDREVTANRPDIIIKNKKEKTCTLIDVVIPDELFRSLLGPPERLYFRFLLSPLSFPAMLSSPDWAPWSRVGWGRDDP